MVVTNSKDCSRSNDENFDVPGSSQEQHNTGSQATASSEGEVSAFICYGARTAPPPVKQEPGDRYRVGGTNCIKVKQAINLNAAGYFAELIGLHLNAHLTIHWFGTDASDDPNKQGGVEGCAELLQFEAALHRIVCHYAGHPEEYAVKLKIPTDGGLCGPYNGRSYDGFYALKGGGPKVWKLFSPIRKEWRKPQGLIFGKRCGTTQNLGPAARREHPEAHEYELGLIERDRRLRRAA